MTNEFKNYKGLNITDETVIFTGPVDTQTTVIGMTIANTGNTLAKASVKLDTAYLVKDIEIPVGSSAVIVGGNQKIVVMYGDTIKVVSDNVVDAVLSTMEIS